MRTEHIATGAPMTPAAIATAIALMALIAWALTLRRNAALRERAARLETQLEADQRSSAERVEALQQAQIQLKETFASLSAEALERNNKTFLEVAEGRLREQQERAAGVLDKREAQIRELMKPVAESLSKVDQQIQAMEKQREGAYQGLLGQVKQLQESEAQLRAEAGKLSQALRSPNVRGRWGEIQLKRVVELAGMLNHVDFFEQAHTVSSEGGAIRPDLLVHLPGGQNIIVDAKAPLDAFLAAHDEEDGDRRAEHLAAHARHIRDHVKTLSTKAYHDQFDTSPEFVVLFLPGDHFFSAALEHDPSLIEYGVEQNVIIATPVTLISVMRAAAYGWRQQSLADNAREVSELGKDLYRRLGKLGEHWGKVGKHITGLTNAYNASVGSLERTVLPAARKFVDLEVAADDDRWEGVAIIEPVPRDLQAPELQQGAAEDDQAALHQAPRT